jgi:DNA polymerase type B, organellar and viral
VTDFLAVDGEALDNKYALMCDSQGRSIYKPNGLSTIQCFNWLLELPKKTVVVCFGLNYDVNNWLKDISKLHLRDLWRDGELIWSNYKIKWIPRKLFQIVGADGRIVTINECWGFFQSSFVKALESWKITVTTRLTEGKSDRGTFEIKELERIEQYCKEECVKLVELMSMLDKACAEAGIKPRSWIGAGSLAAALLTSRGVKDHIVSDLELANDLEPVLGSYYGGRVEMLKQGQFHRIEGYDIISAYPSGAIKLISLEAGNLIEIPVSMNLPQHGIAFVSWDEKDGRRKAMPFPVRKKGSIFYPRKGRGWYHCVEVSAAIRLGYRIKVLRVFCLQQKREQLPFGWIPEVFQTRRKFKDEGRAAEKVLKLALNSVYGKLAQGVGKGQFRSYFWAGEITARTRARMLEMLVYSIDPIACCTDGLYAQSASLDTHIGTTLGDLEQADYTDFESFQPGVYRAWQGEKITLRSRGFFAREIDYDDLLAEYEKNGPYGHVHYDSTRFIGLGQALKLKDWTQWRQWITAPRTVSLYPTRKEILPDGSLVPIDDVGDSEPYEPKIDLEADMNIMDQPLRIDSPGG